MKVKKNKYILGQSETKSIKKLSEEIRLDIMLKEKKGSIGACISGNIKDEEGKFIKNALIKIMDNNFEPLIHTITDENGEYEFKNIPISNAYTIFSIAENKKLNQGQQFALAEKEHKHINFILEEDPAMSLGIIAGDLYKKRSVIPIVGAIVMLYSIECGNEQLEAITHTNEYGQFVFREVEKYKYNIKISALGYISDNMEVEIIKNSEILLIKPTLAINPITETGTVSGLITNEHDNPAVRADVILYKVDGENLIPISFTKTNSSGVYLFINVPIGSYKIMSNEVEIASSKVEAPLNESPYINKIIISQENTSNSIKVKMSDATLEGSAIMNKNGYVENIGKDDKSSILININAPVQGIYKISIKHINLMPKTMNIQVNDSSNNYQFDVSTNYKIPNILVAEINLIKGNNIIKLQGVTGIDTPDIGNIELNMMHKGMIDVSNGVTFGKVRKNVFEGINYINSVGLSCEDAFIIDVDAPIEGEYEIGIYHLNTDEKSLQIDINDKSTGKIYIVPSTECMNINNIKKSTFISKLIRGKNSIKFHNGNKGEEVPLITCVDYCQLQYSSEVLASKTTLVGPVKIDNEFVINVGGKGNGYLEFFQYVPYKGIYDLFIVYTSESEKEASIIINDTDEGIQYKFEKTNSLSIKDAKKKAVKIELMAGKNKVQIK